MYCMAVMAVIAICEEKFLIWYLPSPSLAFLTDKGEVEQHLADTVGNADEQPLEAKHHRVCDMRVYLADKLR